MRPWLKTMSWSRREFMRLATMAGVGACVPLEAQQRQGDGALPAFDGSFLTDDASLRVAAADGGRMLNRPPIGVLKPGSIKDVQQAVRYATAHGVKVAIRGRGQSRYGQTLVAKGIAIDSEPLSAIGNVSGDTIDTQPGADLESVLRAALDKGYTLPVTTRCIRLSVGGFISAGGEGRGSQRYGAFVDQVAELDIVTGDGTVVTCSEARERELFEMTLAGMGQCGVIVGARLKVVRAPEEVASRVLTYTSLEKFVRDQQRLAADARFDFTRGDATSAQDGEWKYTISVANVGPTGKALDPSERVRDLANDTISDLSRQSYRSFAVGDGEQHLQDAARPLPPRPATPPQIVAFPMLALWVPARSVAELLSSLLRSPQDLAGLTDVECTALDTRRFRRPLFQIPSDDCMFSMWLKRSTIKDVGPGLQAQLDANARILERALRLGTKRYAPYGGIVSPGEWASHYGNATYARFQAAKKRFDPRAVLSPGTGMFS